MGKGTTRRRYGRGHPRPGSRTRTLYPPRWTLGENPSSQPGRDLARKYKTAQNFRNWWLRIPGTHSFGSHPCRVVSSSYQKMVHCHGRGQRVDSRALDSQLLATVSHTVAVGRNFAHDGSSTVP